MGELRHKEHWYQAEHPSIITKSCWDDAHAMSPAKQMRIVRLLVRQVNVSPNNMSMDLHPTGIQRLVLELHHKKLQSEPATEMEAEAMA